MPVQGHLTESGAKPLKITGGGRRAAVMVLWYRRVWWRCWQRHKERGAVTLGLGHGAQPALPGQLQWGRHVMGRRLKRALVVPGPGLRLNPKPRCRGLCPL